MGNCDPTPEKRPSPNCGMRRDGALPDLIVIHYTAMQTAAVALERLCDPVAEVSAHYLISEVGQIWQMVEEDQRAWHAGAGQWGDVVDVNSRSFGIELANRGNHPFGEPQMVALEGLMSEIMHRWGILPERVIAHSDMAVGRKIDPGPRFDWRRLAVQGLSIWPDASGQGGAFEGNALRFGYASHQDEAELLAAFRMRFRPGFSGPLDEKDRAMMQNLSDRYPVDRAMPNA